MINGVTIEFDKESDSIQLAIVPKDVKDKLTANSLTRAIRTKFPQHLLFDESIAEVIKEYQSASAKQTDPIVCKVGEAKHYDLEFKIAEDELSVRVKLTAARGGEQASGKDIIDAARRKNIVRGLSIKRANALAEKALQGEPGMLYEDEIAKGLPPRHGRGSKKVPLFENITERFAKPKEINGGKVDMRDFGEIFSVQPGEPVLRFLPPTEGRNGYTVSNRPLLANQGKWGNKTLGPGTVFSDEDENLVLAECEGIPKFDNGKVTVDDVYVSPGCNVETGNIDYDGDVLIFGDVTEGMTVDVKGDLTVHGFVESATLKATGSITISMGATGKMNEELTASTTAIVAKGDIHVEQGRGLMLKSLGKISVGKQLAFSILECTGDVVIGDSKKPNGSIFASEIRTMSKVRVGKLGAISGSKLLIDFGLGKEKLIEKTKQLEQLKTQIETSLVQHKTRIDAFENKAIPDSLVKKLNQLKRLYQKHEHSLKLVEIKLERNAKRLESYHSNIGIETYHTLFHGVQVKFDKYGWEAKEDLNRAKVFFQNYKWQHEPLL
ncbi:MAG: DUF342 domain-containing protein [Alteromonadaceae bacterium]|nr:DUF342 domain-containing protein [Alteromonadaceae bacterium]